MANVKSNRLMILLAVGIALWLTSWVARAEDSATAPLSEKTKLDKETHNQPAVVSHTLLGHCTVLSSSTNPLTGPCVSVPLRLKDKLSKMESLTRTDDEGNFRFDVEREGQFLITPTSRSFEVVPPIGAVKRGMTLELQIRHKN